MVAVLPFLRFNGLDETMPWVMVHFPVQPYGFSNRSNFCETRIACLPQDLIYPSQWFLFRHFYGIHPSKIIEVRQWQN